MFNKRGLAKKGQEGVTITTLALLALAVVVVVVVILGVTGILGDIFGGVNPAVPEQLEAAAQGCILAARTGLSSSYCYQLRDLGGDQYANCEDSRIQDAIAQSDVGSVNIVCDDALVNGTIADFCEPLSTGDKEDARFSVGGGEELECADVLPSETEESGDSEEESQEPQF